MRPDSYSTIHCSPTAGGRAYGRRTWSVNAEGTGDAPSIQAAIDSCAAGDTVLAAPGTYTGAGNRDIDFHREGDRRHVIAGGRLDGHRLRGLGERITIVDSIFTRARTRPRCCWGSRSRTATSVKTEGRSAASGPLRRSSTTSWPEITPMGAAAGYTAKGLIRSYRAIRSRTTRCRSGSRRRGDAVAAGPFESRRVAWRSGRILPGGGNIFCAADSSLIELNTITDGRGTIGSAILCSESFVRVRGNSISANGRHVYRRARFVSFQAATT